MNTKIGHLADFFDWAVGNGEAESNPFEGVRISKKSKLMESAESYEPFTAEEIALIFNPATYPSYATPSKPHYHWLPFLLLHTGARPNEIAGLRLDQIRREQGIDYFALKAAKTPTASAKSHDTETSRSQGFLPMSPSAGRTTQQANFSRC